MAVLAYGGDMSDLPPPNFIYMPPSLLRPIAGIGKALSFFMFLASGLAVGCAVTSFHRWQVVKDVKAGVIGSTSSQVAHADDLVSTWSGFLGMAGLVVFILLIRWTHRNALNMRDMGTPTRGSTAMAIWGFFIPLANAVIPYRYFKDIAAWLAYRGFSPSRYALLPVWWFIYLAGIVTLYTAGSTDYVDNPTIDDLARAEMWGALAMIVIAFALAIGGIVIRNMTQDASAV